MAQTEFPSLAGATEWLNSEPLDADGLRGHVVLVEFGTYTCINWLRTLPYVRAWAEKYEEHGLDVIVVHTPEFPVEYDHENIRGAVKRLMLDLAIAIDDNYAIWNVFENHYWPALYLIDAQGHVRHHRFGEGDYEETERAIQLLLAEAEADGGGDSLVSVEGQGVEAAADWDNLQSPETYLGYERSERFAFRDGPAWDERRVYTAPAQLRLNDWALSGAWTVQRQAAVLNEANGRIAYRFHARDVHLVMGPGPRAEPVRFRALVDGEPPGAGHGVDIDRDGNGTVTESRLYQLLRQPAPVADRLIEIEFLDPGVEVFVFTFG